MNVALINIVSNTCKLAPNFRPCG